MLVGELQPESGPATASRHYDDDATAVVTPLRDAVLRGEFFSSRHGRTGARLAAFIAAPSPAHAVGEWFGLARGHALRADPQALREALDRDIAAIDTLIGEQLDAILHHARLRRLEGSWRGLAWLAEGVEPGARVKLKVLNAGWPEICRDLERAAEFDQSQLFRKIYEEEFGHPGGEPYGLLVVDHEVRHRPAPGAPTDDMAALASLASVAAAAFAPTVLSASPALLQVDAFSDLQMVGDIASPFRTEEYARWRGLSAREDMRFLGITLPRLLARPPWGDDPARIDRFTYCEFAPDADSRVWMGAGYAFAAVVARAFANHAWPADMRGAETDREAGGVVTHLPVEPFDDDSCHLNPDHTWVRPALDLVLTDRQERALVDSGLIPISTLPYGEEAVFGAIRSLQAPPQYAGPNAAAARANARISAQLNSMLCVSRFAHHVKHLGREMVGSFRSEDEIERSLQSWLQGYVNANTTGQADSRARFPLVAARVTVRERAGQPGVFACTILLQPHFQLDDVSAQFRLVTDIAAPGMG